MNDITRVLVPIEPRIIRVVGGFTGPPGPPGPPGEDGGINREFRIATLAEAATMEIPVEVKRVTVERYAADLRLSEATYEESALDGTREPTHAAKFLSSDGRWFVIAEQEIDAHMLGAYTDHDETYTGGHDDTEAFRRFCEVLRVTGRPGTWSGGMVIDGATLALNGAIVVPRSDTFHLRGRTDRESYIYLRNEFDDFFLQFEDRLGLWTGATIGNYIGDRPPPPPQELKRVRLANFAVFGEGSKLDGTPVARQKGISLNGRHDNVYVDRVYLYNIDGCAFHFGRSVDGEVNGFRESRIEHFVVSRCGSETEFAWIIDGGEDSSFGPNFIDCISCECSLSRGDGILVRNSNPNNSMHQIHFKILKCHGTGAVGGNMPPPVSRRALVLEGQCTNSIDIDGVLINQYASLPGDYMIQYATNHGREFIATVGALAGNMLSMAAAYDGERVQPAATCARLDGGTSAWVAMQLPSGGLTIARAVAYGSNDQGFVEGSDPTVTAKLYGKVGTTPPTSPLDGTQIAVRSGTDANNKHLVLNSSDSATLFDWLIVEISIPAAGNIRLAEIAPFTRVDTWPTSIKFSGSFATGENGILVEGGGNHRFEILDAVGLNGNLLRVLGNVTEPIRIQPPLNNSESVIVVDPGVSQMIRIEGTTIEPPVPWTILSEAYLPTITRAPTTAYVQVPFLVAHADANSTIRFSFRIYYQTTAAAAFKYSINLVGSLATMTVTQRHLPPGAVAWTVVTGTSLPVNVVVPATGVPLTGYGTVEVEAVVTTAAAAADFTFRFAQNVSDPAGLTQVLPGSTLTVLK